MQSKDTRLLKHPVVQMLLEQKLKKFGWFLYYINLLKYLLLVSLLMTLILLLPNPNSVECEDKEGDLDNSFLLISVIFI